MGCGDEILAAGHAEREAKRLGARVHIVDRDGSPRWSDLWNGNPFIARPGELAAGKVVNGPGVRPYIQYPFSREQGHGYTDWRARDHRGHLYLTPAEESVGLALMTTMGGYTVIEPNIKALANPNKAWPWVDWLALVNLMPDVRWVQMGPAGTKRLPGVTFVQTATFRDAAGVIDFAECVVTSEGGLHHCAAALQVPAVVIFGGSCSADATGYPEHINFGGTDPCGRWLPCKHCEDIMCDITPAKVADAVRSLTKENE